MGKTDLQIYLRSHREKTNFKYHRYLGVTSTIDHFKLYVRGTKFSELQRREIKVSSFSTPAPLLRFYLKQLEKRLTLHIIQLSRYNFLRIYIKQPRKPIILEFDPTCSAL